MVWIVAHLFDSNFLVVKLLWGNATVFIVQEIEDGRDEWHDLFGDMIAKGGEVFGVYSFDNLLDDGSFYQ